MSINNKDKNRKHREWRAKNKDKVRKYDANFKTTHPNWKKEYNKRYYQSPEGRKIMELGIMRHFAKKYKYHLVKI